MLKMRWVMAAVVAAPGVLVAQDTAIMKGRPVASGRPSVAVRTFTLTRLSADQAARLIGPYAAGAGEGVFPGASSHEVTVRAPQQVLSVVDSLLREHDKVPTPVMLTFQLYAATDSVGDELPADIGPALHSMFRFKGYSLISQGSITTNEDQSFFVTLGANQASRAPTLYAVRGNVESVTGSGKGTLPLKIYLSQVSPANSADILSTGLTVPLGQTVILGSGAVRLIDMPAPGTAASGVSTQALILAVHPDAARAKRE